MGEQRRIHTDHSCNLIDKRKQFAELFRRDLLILGTRVAYDLVFVHLLVCLQDICRLEPLLREDSGQAGEVEEFSGGSVFLPPGILYDSAVVQLRKVYLIGAIEPDIFGVVGLSGKDVAVLIFETRLVKRLADIFVIGFQLVAGQFDHDRFQPALAYDRSEALFSRYECCRTGELHAREIPALTDDCLHIVAVLVHRWKGLAFPESLLHACRRLVGKVHTLGRTSPTAFLQSLPGKQLALAGRVDIRCDHDAIGPFQLIFKTGNDVLASA